MEGIIPRSVGTIQARVLDMEGTIPLTLAGEVSHWLGAGLNKMKGDWTLGFVAQCFLTAEQRDLKLPTAVTSLG